MHAAKKHLKTREVKYFIAGNGITKSSEYMAEMQNNHAEGETSIIHGLSSMYVRQKHVTVYGNDSDLFALLLMHYKSIDCNELYMKSHSGYTSITAVYNFLGHDVATAVLSLHALTGCDTIGKFSGKSKEFWTGKFLSERSNVSLIQALNHLQQEQSEEVVNEVAQFACRTYCPKNTPKHITNSIVETRYFLCKKFSADTNKLPPTVGAFTQHVKRASCQLLVWISAHMSEIAKPDLLIYGWEKW